MAFPTRDIIRLVAAGYPHVYLVSWEEERVEKRLREMAATVFTKPLGFHTWTCTEGLTGRDEGGGEDTRDPAAALDRIGLDPPGRFYLFKDLHHFLDDRRVARKLKELGGHLRKNSKTVFILSPTLSVLPPLLEKDVAVVDIGLPDEEEAAAVLDAEIASRREAASLRESLTPQMRAKCITALKGLSAQEMELALRRSLLGKDSFDEDVLQSLLEEKAQLVRKSGSLTMVDATVGLDDIGGLENLKEWLEVRGVAFTERGMKLGLDRPKGVLIMGVSGCGKSLCAKAVARAWDLPLVRLDLNQIYSGVFGSPEESFRRAIKTVEAVSPCVLWIDEIEAGITRSGEKAGDSPASRIFGYFLTWMQEKTHNVFIAATANQIDLLPPELLRKGRFDEIFFVSLPSERERREILRIHLRKRGLDPDKFNIEAIARNTEGLSGAELEQAVISAMYDAVAKDKEVGERELIIAASSIVPLSTTMREEISRLERWAAGRAVRASVATAA